MEISHIAERWPSCPEMEQGLDHVHLRAQYRGSKGAKLALVYFPLAGCGAAPRMLPAFRLAERRYADIDPDPDAEVWGVLWRITDAHLDGLDVYEGYPRFYTRYSTEVIHLDLDAGDRTPLPALVYEMTARAKSERDGEPLPEHYREARSEGARQNRVSRSTGSRGASERQWGGRG